jgi:hypothetical protein
VGHLPNVAIPCRLFTPPQRVVFAEGLLLRPEAASIACGVGNHEYPITSVRGADGGSGYAVPLRVIPDLGKVSEYVSHPPSKEAWHVLHDREPGS